MVNRSLFDEISKLAKQFPAVAILGPRQIGKTTLAKLLSKKLDKKTVYLDIEKPSDRLKLEYAEEFFDAHKKDCVILDEVQYMPELFNVLRPMIDDYRKSGRFILTGSASPALVRGVSESLAGRIAYTELSTFNHTELPKRISLVQHWFRGGFPDSLLAKTNDASSEWLTNFVKSYVERDLNLLFNQSFSPALVRNFWRMVASNNGGLLNAEKYGRSLGVTAPTVNRYIDYLEGAFLLRRLHPWHANVTKRLVKSPKLYIRDSGLLHCLADVSSMEQLRGNVLLGESWEGFVLEQILQLLPDRVLPFFYRTHDGAEVDLVLLKQNKIAVAIEIKYGRAQRPTRGFYESLKDLKPQKAFVITYAGDTYPLDKNILSCSFKTFMSEYIHKL